MATTANYKISLIEEGTYDWKQAFDQIIDAIDTVLAKNQMPSGLSLKWGDIANGAYLEVDAAGPKCHGNLDMLLNQLQNVTIHNGSSLPSSGVAGQLFYNTTNLTLYVSSGATWAAIGAVTAAAVQAAGAVLQSDLASSAGVLLTRNAALALTSVAPTAINQVAVSAANNTLVFQSISDFFATGQAQGSLRVGSGADAEAFLPLPSVDPEGQILTVSDAAGNKIAWRTPASALGAVFGAKGQVAIGSAAGTLALTAAPLDNQVLVGDPTQVSGWVVKNISDIVSFTANDAVVFSRLHANATLG
jgi:hypothetical protein